MLSRFKFMSAITLNDIIKSIDFNKDNTEGGGGGGGGDGGGAFYFTASFSSKNFRFQRVIGSCCKTLSLLNICFSSPPLPTTFSDLQKKTVASNIE